VVELGFNPRSRGGSDRIHSTTFKNKWCFNPRSRGGSDGTDAATMAGVAVSIHAPAGGATLEAVMLL